MRTTVPGKVRPGSFAEGERDGLADGDAAEGALRDIDEGAQRGGVLELEEDARGVVQIAGDELADFDEALRDGAGEGRGDLLEALHLLESLDVGLGGGEIGLAGVERTFAFIDFLRGDDAALSADPASGRS